MLNLKFLFVLFYLITSNLINSQCLLQEITDPDPYPQCAIGNSYCIKIKFHFLNNTQNQMNSPSDEIFRKLLADLNILYAQAKIRFTFVDECVSRVDVPSNITISTIGNLESNLLENNVPRTTSPFNYVDDAINVYFLQDDFQPASAGWGYGKFRTDKYQYLYSIPNAHVLAHEIGHCLSLNHVGGGNLLPTDLWECKSRTVVSQQDPNKKRCQTTGDLIEDTGPDPRLKPKIFNWPSGNVVDGNCIQNPEFTNDVKDACEDAQLPWIIPAKNIMYANILSFENCAHEFSKCQISAMHHKIDLYLSDLIIDCNDDIYHDPNCDDIIINSNVSWSNGTRHMCPNQKIIINPNGTLTLDNYTLTYYETAPQGPNSNCPGLTFTDLWDGIYFYGTIADEYKYHEFTENVNGSYDNFSPGSYPSYGGKLYVKNNSVIKYSKNGIQAISDFNIIKIENSILTNNLKAIYSIRNNTAVKGEIQVTSSQVLVKSDQDIAKVQIKVHGPKVMINKSNITLEGTKDITAIQSANGTLNVVNGSSISNFGIGIEKLTSSVYLSRGLYMNNSSTKNCNCAIKNTGQFLNLYFNYFEGSVESYGICVGTITANNFRNQLSIDNPNNGMSVSKNYFAEDLLLERSNKYTNVFCNKWKVNTALSADGVSSLPSSWGLRTKPSGNIWDESRTLWFKVNPVPHTNYFRQNDLYPEERHDWFPANAGTPTDQNAQSSGCVYSYPITYPTGNLTPTPYDCISSNSDSDYLSLESQISEYQSQLNGADSVNMLNLVDQAKIDRSLLIGKMALCGGDTLNESTNYSTWYLRLDTLLKDQFMFLNFWNSDSFLVSSTYAPAGADTIDRAILIEAINLINTWQENGSVSFNLFEDSKNQLVDLASQSFGDYTAILRAFLNRVYDIQIYPPDSLYNRNKRTTFKHGHRIKSEITLSPNPTNDCFSIFNSNSYLQYPLNVKLIDFSGNELYSFQLSAGENLCIGSKINSGFYLVEINDIIGKTITRKKIIIL